MRHLFSSTALALALSGSPALAEDLALVLGNERYETLDRFARGTEIVDAAAGLAPRGFDVIALPNGRTANTASALRDFVSRAPDAERIVVALAGQFVTDGDRTWFLTSDSPSPGLLSLDERAISVDSLMTILAGSAGQAILLLGADTGDGEQVDPWLSLGLPDLDPPQGVTVVTGGPRAIATFMQNALVQPGADIAAVLSDRSRFSVAGFMPDSFVFLPRDRAEIPLAPVVPDETALAEERALWTGTVALDTIDAYRNYLNAYPRGQYATEAEEAIAAIIAEPNRDARLAEEALNLTRDARREIQRDLTLLGFETRGIDGIFGQATRGAITAWQQQNGLPQTGYLTAPQINRLDGQAARRAAQLEAEAARQAQIAAAADRAFWDETGARADEAGYRAYLDRYPDGQFAETATRELARIEEAKRAAAASADNAAWDTARRADTIPAYRTYLRENPDGAFRGEAQARIRELAQDSEVADRVAEARATEAALGLNTTTLRLVEARLDQLGLNPGEVDGTLNPDSRRAIRNYQRDRGLEVTGFLDEQTLVRLLADSLGSN